MAAVAPAVSVITATYNRPRVLAYAIRSVLAQTVGDWELIVVGDACAPATAEVVASFADPRLRYHNLPVNFGEQSGPNNVGVELARAPLIAFLNHDDLWFPDHLATALAALDRARADLVFAPIALIQPADATTLVADAWTVPRTVRHRRGRYDPATTMAPASSWVFRRRLHEGLGGWRPARELYGESSQDFLFRAWRTGARLVAGPQTTALMFSSAWRARAYVADSDLEQAHFWRRLSEDADALRRDVVARSRLSRAASAVDRLLRTVKEAAWRGLAHLGWSPREARFRRKGGTPGSQMRALRQARGLEPR